MIADFCRSKMRGNSLKDDRAIPVASNDRAIAFSPRSALSTVAVGNSLNRAWDPNPVSVSLVDRDRRSAPELAIE